MSTSSTRPSNAVAGDPKAPLRLGEGGGTEFERQLVSSASRDGVPAASMAKVAAGLREAVAAQRRIGTAAGGTLAGARGVGTFGVARNLRLWASGAVGVGIVGAGLVAATLASEWQGRAAPVESAAPTEAVAPLVEQPAEPSAPPRAETPPNLRMESASRAPAPSRSPAPRASAKAPRDRARPNAASPAAAADPASGLAAEVRAIESVQTLLGWGQAQQAAAALADYRRRYPKGELALEADLLDVDVALARGDRSKAKQLARALLARPAASRYRARLEAIDDANERLDPRAAGSIERPAHMKERR